MSIPVNLVGRLTADPELRFSATGVAVAKFSVVTSRRVKDQQSGEWSDADTSYWDCVAFKQLAENIAESLTKGAAVLVVGKAAQRTWETKEGEKRRSVEVTVDDVGPSLRSATANVNKAQRQGGGFGGGQSAPAGAPGSPDDPWMNKPASGGGGFDSDDPPF